MLHTVQKAGFKLSSKRYYYTSLAGFTAILEPLNFSKHDEILRKKVSLGTFGINQVSVKIKISYQKSLLHLTRKSV